MTMSKIFFTADCHFNHANIIKFCGRPFIKDGDLDDKNNWVSEDVKFDRCNAMNKELISRWNRKVSSDDIVYHIGDFSFGNRGSCKRFEDMLNGTIVHIVGNHDKNNGVKSYIDYCVMRFSSLMFYVKHIPPADNQIGTLESRIMDSVDFVLCGHVHDNWKHKVISFNATKDITCINVGVDVWNFEPVGISSILKYIMEVKDKK